MVKKSLQVAVVVLAFGLGNMAVAAPAFWDRGPLRASGHILKNGDDEFYWIADTSWQLKRRTDVEEWVKTRAAQGFSVIQVAATTLSWGGDYRYDKDGNLPFLDEDVASFNPSYWHNISAILRLAEQHGMYVSVHTDIGKAKSIGCRLKQCKAHGRALAMWGSQHPNIIFNVGLDERPDKPGSIGVSGYNAMIQGIREVNAEAFVLFHTGADDPPSSQYGLRGLSAHSLQNWGVYSRYKDLHDLITRTRSFGKPVILVEGLYAKHSNAHRGLKHASDLEVRRQAWTTVFSGGYYSYGISPHWSSEFKLDELQHPSAVQVARMQRFVKTLSGSSLVPDQRIIIAGNNKKEQKKVAMRGVKQIVVYFPDDSRAKIAIENIQGDTVSIRWLDPQTGQTVLQGAAKVGDKSYFSPPEPMNDAVLLIVSD